MTLNAIIANFQTFKLVDLLDIIIISFLIYQLLGIVNRTRAGQLFKGALLVMAVYLVAETLNMRTVTWLLNSLLQVGLLTLVVLFQPEIRRALERMGQTDQWAAKLFNVKGRYNDPSLKGAWRSAIIAICDAAERFSETKTGALIVLERHTNLSEIVRTGTPVNSAVNLEVLGTIFYEGTPLHDGAAIIENGRIKAAGCVLPLSNNLDLGKDMGTRHRACLGIAENSDAIAIVVSEETGIISMAKNGVLIRHFDRQTLYTRLVDEMIPKETAAEKTAVAHKKNILDDRRIRLALSVLGAIVAWMVVTIIVQPGTTNTIYNVPVDYTYDSAAYTSRGLSIVSAQDKTVNLKISGDGYTIGGLTASDFVVYPDFSSVRDSGEKTLRLLVRGANGLLNGVTVTMEGNDNTVDVVFDVVEEKTLPVTVTTNYLTIADGYILYSTDVSKENITLSGPSSELDKAVTCTAEVTYSGELTESVTLSTPLRFYTSGGREVKFEYTELEENSVDVTLQVYKMATLPVNVNFINAPRDFDDSVLVYALSRKQLKVAGPEAKIDMLSTLPIGSIDLSTFTLNKSYELPIDLPTDIYLLDNISTITVSFDCSALETKTMNLPNTCVQVVNLPPTYQLTVQTERLMNVTLCGPKNAMASLTPEQVVIEIDAEDFSVATGEQNIACRLYVPSNGKIFALGSYVLQCRIDSN